MALLIHASRAGASADEVVYDFVLPPAPDVERVAIPLDDPNAFRLDTGSHRNAAARVVARAVRVQREEGQWPETFTIAS